MAFVIWLYSLITLKMSTLMPKTFIDEVRTHLLEKQYESAISVCKKEQNFSSSILLNGISARNHGLQMVMDIMKSEAKRCGSSIWQRISLLNEIAMAAPMLGLLGTVTGLFFAFYDVNRSAESLASIFDGLGIAVGTTVMGLVVAILSMIFYTSLKFKIVNLLNRIEKEMVSLVAIMDLNKEEK